MIGPKDKKFKKHETSTTEISNTNLELKNLPKYISYRAALLKEKQILSYLVVILCALMIGQFTISRLEISSLYKQLRTKEYILAPGVLDFTTATPQSVPDSYVNDAVSDFLSTLGNINASNISDQYKSLKRFMSPELKIQFNADSGEWIQQIKQEDLAQLFKIKSKKIISNSDGYYFVTAFVRANFYASNQSLGHEDQVVEMTLKLVPPDRAKRWYLQIIDLSWSKLDKFNTRKSFSKPDIKE
ncbi:MAG: TraE/TraK family type IV conjugative transfer system protein [Oligoflexales bacterium]